MAKDNDRNKKKKKKNEKSAAETWLVETGLKSQAVYKVLASRVAVVVVQTTGGVQIFHGSAGVDGLRHGK